MQTNLLPELLATKQGQRADEILRKCVHCGFCNATCPTHKVSGDELEGPRGRIYLIKEMLEGQQVSNTTLQHLDSCLTCLSCETTCPSGVQYGELAEVGKNYIEQKNIRSVSSRLKRWMICKTLPYPKRFAPLALLARTFGMLTSAPTKPMVLNSKNARQKVLLLDGCVQSVTHANINQHLKAILATLDIEAHSVKQVQCCGAIEHHNGQPEKALLRMKANIDCWWPHIEQGVSAIVMTASGCGSSVKDYARLLSDDATYAEKAQKISQLTKDASEFLATHKLHPPNKNTKNIAFHPPCTLQHDQKINGVVENILTTAGYTLVQFNDVHLCCGSAGTYSILQPKMAKQLRDNKLDQINKTKPDIIVTANIGCLLHLQKGTNTQVKHWLELISE